MTKPWLIGTRAFILDPREHGGYAAVLAGIESFTQRTQGDRVARKTRKSLPWAMQTNAPLVRGRKCFTALRFGASHGFFVVCKNRG